MQVLCIENFGLGLSLSLLSVYVLKQMWPHSIIEVQCSKQRRTFHYTFLIKQKYMVIFISLFEYGVGLKINDYTVRVNFVYDLLFT